MPAARIAFVAMTTAAAAASCSLLEPLDGYTDEYSPLCGGPCTDASDGNMVDVFQPAEAGSFCEAPEHRAQAFCADFDEAPTDDGGWSLSLLRFGGTLDAGAPSVSPPNALIAALPLTDGSSAYA